MNEKHKKYQYSKIVLPKSGDYEDYLYHIKNTETNESFDYRLNISASTLASTELPLNIQLAADTKGDNLIKQLLDEEIEEKQQIRITTTSIESKRIDKNQDWIDWQDFSSLVALAKKDDFEKYFNRYKEIFKKILKPKYGIEAKAYVSKKQGSLLYLKIRPGRDMLEYYLVEDKSIGHILMDIPQRGFTGNLENMIFRGVNKVIEKDKIIYIKGENTRDIWSEQIAEKEAKEEILMIKERYIK